MKKKIYKTVINIISGRYSEWDWVTTKEVIVLIGHSKKDILKQVQDAKDKYTDNGHKIDFGYIDRTTRVDWDGNVWKLVKV